MDYNKYITKKSLIMNSGTSSTELNDMFTDFVNYVDSFYGQNDPLYPMMSQETKQPLTKFDILRATENYLSMCADDDNKLCVCLLYTSPSPRDLYRSRMPSSA